MSRSIAAACGCGAAVRGMAINVSLPVDAFLGVALRLKPSDGERDDEIAVSLEHRDPALSLPLFAAADNFDAVADWQLWARVLGVPLLIADLSGKLASRSRPSAPCGSARRAGGGGAATPSNGGAPHCRCGGVREFQPLTPVVRREREIIARN